MLLKLEDILEGTDVGSTARTEQPADSGCRRESTTAVRPLRALAGSARDASDMQIGRTRVGPSLAERRLRQRLPLLSVTGLLVCVVDCTNAECFTYLAPSTIPGAGFGMFAGEKSYRENDAVTFPDVVIPIIDLDWNNDFQKIDNLWAEYVWSSSMFSGMALDSDQGDNGISVASGGMGAAVNCHLSLHNVIDYTIDIDQANVPPDSPGIGAFTPYHGRSFYAVTDIPAGMELFADYGYGYFEHRASTYGPIPFEGDYEQADQLLHNFLKLEEGNLKQSQPTSVTSTAIPSHIASDLYHTIIQLRKEIFSRTLAALPANRTQISPVLSFGGTERQDFNRSIRSLEWLQQNGQCMDNIRPDVSTLPDAGRGAFANRFIANGTLVAPAPLIHIPDSSIFTIYEPAKQTSADDYIVRDKNRPRHSQLLLNYCFAHERSTLLLCPYGLLTALINHRPTEANAKIVWTRNMRHPEWRDQPIARWAQSRHSGLSFDFVATRDIEEGEEIFIDYGTAWEAAWRQHVDMYFANGPPRPHFMQAADRNSRLEIPIRTRNERDYDLDDVRLTVAGDYVHWSGVTEYSRDDDFDCVVLDRNDDTDTYIVQIVHKERTEDMCMIDSWEGEGAVLFNFPRNAFFFYDAEHCTRDHVQPWSFRHPMMIPDELFPEAWMNRW